MLDASHDPADYVPLTSANRADIDGLALSTDAKARIGDAIGAGRVVLAPRAPVDVGGTPVTAWLESDPNTGATISTFEDGTHGAFAEYAAIYFERFGEQSLEDTMAKFVGNVNSIGVVSIAYMAGLVDAIAANAAATARARANVTLAAGKGLALDGVPTSVVVPAAPATRAFALKLRNAGNVEDSYSLAIVATTGAVTAALHDAAGAPVQSLGPVTLPGQALGATLASGTVATVTVRATSQTTASLHADVTLTLSAGAAPQLAIQPGALGFGSQALGTTSTPQTATLSNNGGGDVTITSLAAGGADPGDFALASGTDACTIPVTLAANGGSCILYATFAPSAAGARAATITAADAGAADTATLSLAGTGAAPDTCFTGNVPGGTATACFSGGGPSCQYASAAFIALEGDAGSPPRGSAPAGYTFPFGLFAFSTTGCTTSGNLAFTIDYPSALPARSVYYKYGSPDGVAPPQWYTIAAGVAGSRVTFSLPAGNIADPGGPAAPAAAPPPPPTAPVVPVPALHWPALALLALTVLVTGLSRRPRARGARRG